MGDLGMYQEDGTLHEQWEQYGPTVEVPSINDLLGDMTEEERVEFFADPRWELL